MHIFLTPLLFGLLLLSNCLGADAGPSEVYSYSMEEMHQMAGSLNAILDGQTLTTEEYMSAAEFKGYVAAIMDLNAGQDAQLSLCARQNRIGNIAARAASLISSLPLDRSQNAALVVNMAIRFACE